MVNRKRKYQSGEGARYITRKGALRKLQLSLRDFRALCIVKGIYPREPKNRRKAQRGKTGIQTLYLKKDIQFLLHEPIVWKMRELKVHLKRIKRAKSMKDYKAAKRYGRTIPLISLDHIVKERYPTFVDALRDLDDSLTLCFLFATMPKMKTVPPHLMAFCRRLTVEFMHLVIATKALRYVFISIKGFYFQVEIKGQTITWIIPHGFSFEQQSQREVDFRTMSTFVEFYITLLGFVNFRLYNVNNLKYPPKLEGYTVEELEIELIDDMVPLSGRIAALNVPLERVGSVQEEQVEIDQFPMNEDAESADKAREELEKISNLKKLFDGLNVFLNREVPREPLVFILRSFGASVSWDGTICPAGGLLSEDDEAITHQIVDRPPSGKQYMSRYYVQPQWVFDSVNARQLLPVEKYFYGVTLPPHLSPFSQGYRTQRYVPPEEKALKDPSFVMPEDVPVDEGADSMDEEEDTKNEEEDSEEEMDSVEDDGETEDMRVESGEKHAVNKNARRADFRQTFSLREKMIRNKYKRLYRSMKQGKNNRQKEIKLLKYKRRLSERQILDEKKALLKAQRARSAAIS